MQLLVFLGITIAFVALIFLGLAVKILFKKDGEFPEHRIGHNRLMRKKKVYCVKTQDVIERKQYYKRLKAAAEEQRLIMQNIPIDDEDLPSKTDYRNLRLAES